VWECLVGAKGGEGGQLDCGWIGASTTTGSVNANVESQPSCDSTQILPPCISMMRVDIAGPKPVPPFLRVIALSAQRRCQDRDMECALFLPVPVGRHVAARTVIFVRQEFP